LLAVHGGVVFIIISVAKFPWIPDPSYADDIENEFVGGRWDSNQNGSEL
jgi:hypothetical protein